MTCGETKLYADMRAGRLICSLFYSPATPFPTLFRENGDMGRRKVEVQLQTKQQKSKVVKKRFEPH